MSRHESYQGKCIYFQFEFPKHTHIHTYAHTKTYMLIYKWNKIKLLSRAAFVGGKINCRRVAWRRVCHLSWGLFPVFSWYVVQSYPRKGLRCRTAWMDVKTWLRHSLQLTNCQQLALIIRRSERKKYIWILFQNRGKPGLSCYIHITQSVWD